MSLPIGFLELAPGPSSLGPFASSFPAGTEDPTFPVFVRLRLYWGKPGEPAPASAQGYPAAVLYGGPAPMAWALSTLPAWVRDWSQTLQPPAGGSADGSRWLVLLGAPALLVPHEALAFPHSDFRWTWLLEHAAGDRYTIEGTRSEPDYRNTRTGAIEGPPALGAGPTAIAGCTCPPKASAAPASGGASSVEAYADSDEWDPRAIVWLTEDEWAIHGGGVWPWWILNDYSVDAVGAVAGLHGRPELPSGLVEYYRQNKLGGPRGNIQCAASTQLGGVTTECSLVHQHPGPHMNGPAELGRIWWQCRATLADPKTRCVWRCESHVGHPGNHAGSGHIWRNPSPRAPLCPPEVQVARRASDVRDVGSAKALARLGNRADTSIGALPSRTDVPTWNVLRYTSKATSKVLSDQKYYRTLKEMWSKSLQERIKWSGRGANVAWLTWDGRRWVDGQTAHSAAFKKEIAVALADKPAWAR